MIKSVHVIILIYTFNVRITFQFGHQAVKTVVPMAGYQIIYRIECQN
jgi:hypothetical protein